jgi:peptide/nickel transport system permease protein
VTAAPVLATPTAPAVRARSATAILGRRLLRSRSLQIGLTISLLVVLVALGAPLLSRADPTALDTANILKGPSAAHPFGTDEFGRDLLSRALYGARVSILVGVTVALVTTLTGLLFGALAGYYPRLDNPIMRAMDVLMAFPGMLLAIGIMAILGQQTVNIILALMVPYTPRAARVVRGQVLALRDQEFIQAARCLGMNDGRIILRHLAPNVAAPLLIQQTFILASAILAESGLSFLGVGVPPEVPTLGGILSDSRAYLRTAPWMSLYPGILISLLVLGFNLLGDGLRDALDPRTRV